MSNWVGTRKASWLPDLTMTVQDATIAALEALSDPARRITVEAFADKTPTTELCSEDTSHGPGLVLVPISDGRETVAHEQCLACAIKSVERQIEDGRTWISVDVTS